MADEPQLELIIRVSTVVAEESQAALGAAEHEVGIAIIVEIGRGKRVDGQIGEFVEAEVGGRFTEASLAEIAPDSEAFAKGANVEPAIVVVVKQLQFRDGKAVEWNMEMLAGLWINDFDFVARGEHQVEFYI